MRNFQCPSKPVDFILDIIYTADLIGVRVLLGVSSLLMGMVLLLVGDSLDRPAYVVLLRIMPELSWAWLFLVSGAATLYALICVPPTRLCFYMGGILSSILWTMLTMGVVLSTVMNHQSGYHSLPPQLAVFIPVTLAAWWVLFRYPKG